MRFLILWLIACAVPPLPPPNAGLPATVVIAPKARLFVFESDEPVSFWMKDTLIPLDMIFVASDGTVRRIFERVPVLAPGTPDNAIPLESASARYVIELAAGEAEQDGIESGTRLRFARTP